MVTTEQVFENIYRIGVPLADNPLKELNSYFIKGEKFDLLIDTGFRTKECEEALREGLEQLGSDSSRRHFAATHLHSDHSSMGDIFAGPDCPIYMDETDLNILWKIYTADRKHGYVGDNTGFRELGYTPDQQKQIVGTSPSSIYNIHRMNELYFIAMHDKDLIDMGNFRLQWVSVPGHTPGNAMIWDEDHGIMFTGDHVLFDITPNITAWYECDDSLGNYLENLEKALKYPVKLALPGHRKTGDYHERIRTIIKHHHKRLNEAYAAISNYPGLSTIEIAGHMTWKIHADSWEVFPIVQKYFAVGECQSHLDYMMKRGYVTREMIDGIWRYKVIEGSHKPFED